RFDGRPVACASVGVGRAGRGETTGVAAAGPVGGFAVPTHFGLEPLAAAVQVAELAFQISLEPSAVFALELLELLDVLLQGGALGVQATHGLGVPGAGVTVEGLRLRAGIPHELLGLR